MKLIGAENNEENVADKCLVCGAVGASNYYNSFTCYECKEFFKSRRHILCLWRCPNGNNRCEITQAKKFQCTVCWMMKCIKAGMKLYLSDFEEKVGNPSDSPERMTSRATNLTPKRGEQVQGLLKIYDRCFRQVISVKERKEWTFLNQIPVPTGSDHYKRRVKDLAVFSSEIVKFIISVRKNFNQCVSNDPKSVLEMRDLVFQLMVFLAAVKFNFFSEKQRDMMAHLRYNIVSPITSFFGDFYLLGQYVSFQQLDKTELCLCLSALAFETDETEKYLRGLLRDYSSDTYGHAQPNRWIKIHDQMDCTRDLLRTKGGIVFLAQTDLLQGLSGPSIDSLILKTFFQEPKQNAF